MNKSLVTNLIAAVLLVGSFYAPKYNDILFSVGMFALSGAITNWIAVHMLFEKIPLLYGSGVIPNRFEEFKTGIKQLIINEFFSKQHIEKFLTSSSSLSAEEILKKVDTDKAFNHLVDAIAESSLGGMLSMVGGKSALEPLKEPIEEKLKIIISDIANDSSSNDSIDLLISKVEKIIDNRLNELTPQKVKEIVQDMIRQHLGWLVVWGGVFGGLIGLAVSLY